MTTAAIVSLLLHAVLLTGASFQVRHELPREDKIAVTIVSLPAPQVPPPNMPKQIVAPSDSKSEEPIVPTPLVSEHASRTDKEMLRRGDPLSEAPAPTKLVPPSPPKKAAKQKEEVQKEEKKSAKSQQEPKSPVPKQYAKLRLNDQQLESAFARTETQADREEETDSPEQAEKQRAQQLQQAEPFRKAANPSIYLNRGGSADMLSHIPDGDITLLHAKADQYAVFVRRVALQVFGALRKLNWQELSRSELQRLKGYVTVEAVMDKQGKFIRVNLAESSGSTRFDQIANKAANEGTWDQNPPAAAAATDGNIHFVFKARSWSRASPNGLNEQRWLMLGTGLL